MEKIKKRGVTLFETLIAMALVIVISLAIYTTLNYSVTSHSKDKINSFFAGETENIAMCFYCSNDNYTNINTEKFENLFKFTYSIENDDEYIEYDLNEEVEPNTVNTMTIFYSKNFIVLKTSEKENASYKIVFDLQSENKTIKTYYTSGGSAFVQREV